MFAELVINVEVPLEGTFHYDVPRDLAAQLQVGQLVEVEFGRRLAQGIVVAFAEEAPVEETKPIIALIDEEPVVRPWQIQVAQWMSEAYLTPLNACLRLMLPPGSLTDDQAHGVDGVESVERDAGAVTLVTRRAAESIQALAALGALDGLQVRSGTLEDVFISLTGRQLADPTEEAP